MEEVLIAAALRSAVGKTAENVAAKYQISRREPDEFAAHSQQKAQAAQKAGKFTGEIVPLSIAGKTGTTVFDSDEFIRHRVTARAGARANYPRRI